MTHSNMNMTIAVHAKSKSNYLLDKISQPNSDKKNEQFNQTARLFHTNVSSSGADEATLITLIAS